MEVLKCESMREASVLDFVGIPLSLYGLMSFWHLVRNCEG